ncbi:MAG: hypothetical protein ACFFBJ_12410, partial [Promethearchaeota archaeon]
QEMTVVDQLEEAVKRIQSIFDKGLSTPQKYANDQKYRSSLVSISEALQDLYNIVDTSLSLLKGYPDESKEFLYSLKGELLGKRYTLVKLGEDVIYHGADIEPFVEVSGYKSNKPFNWTFKQKILPIGGVHVAIELVTRSMGLNNGSELYAEYIKSASQAFQQTVGAIKRLQSRLKYTVMFPDSLSKDALKIREYLKKHELDDIWHQFNTGLDNFRTGDLLGSTNRITNALTSFLRSAAIKYGYRGGQLGEHTIFLEKIDYIHDYVREMISSYFGYLSKFRKGVEPSLDEARLLLDLAFSLFGFLVPRLDSFEISEERAKYAKKKTKAFVKKRQEENAKRTLSKGHQ